MQHVSEDEEYGLSLPLKRVWSCIDLPLFSFCWANSNKFNGKKPKLKAFNHLYSCRNFPDVCTFEVTWNFLHISMAMGQNLWYHIFVVIHIHLPSILMFTRIPRFWPMATSSTHPEFLSRLHQVPGSRQRRQRVSVAPHESCGCLSDSSGTETCSLSHGTVKHGVIVGGEGVSGYILLDIDT